MAAHYCRAVEGDNWSSVIDGQTSDTIDPTLVEARMKAALHPIATPFSQASVHRSIGRAPRCLSCSQDLLQLLCLGCKVVASIGSF